MEIAERELSFINYLDGIIDYLKATTEESWCTDVVRNKEGQNCFFGHLFAMGKDNKQSNELWDMFENSVATTYMIYPVNDGKHPKYQQPTPKQRVISYLEAIRDGKELTTWESAEEEMKLLNNPLC